MAGSVALTAIRQTVTTVAATRSTVEPELIRTRYVRSPQIGWSCLPDKRRKAVTTRATAFPSLHSDAIIFVSRRAILSSHSSCPDGP